MLLRVDVERVNERRSRSRLEEDCLEMLGVCVEHRCAGVLQLLAREQFGACEVLHPVRSASAVQADRQESRAHQRLHEAGDDVLAAAGDLHRLLALGNL